MPMLVFIMTKFFALSLCLKSSCAFAPVVRLLLAFAIFVKPFGEGNVTVYVGRVDGVAYMH